MAGGINGICCAAARPLRTRVQTTRVRHVLITLFSALGLASCSETSVSPTLAPAPTLAVVTATPGPPAVPTPGVQQQYVVREGDTLSGIAARFGVSEEAILKQNAIDDPNKLLVGQELVIPAGEP